MAKIIYRILLIIAAALCIFFLGAIINVPNPIRNLLITIGITVVLTIGYLLGRRSLFKGEGK
mgnify:CR=1 FL=1